MISRFFYWLFHLHDWKDFERHNMRDGQSTVGMMFVQRCSECQAYRTQKLMYSANLTDYSR